MNRLIPVYFAAAMFACGGGQKASDGPANPCAANPCAANPCAANPCGDNPCAANPCGGGGGAAAAGEGGDYSGWSGWSKVSDAIFISKGHRKQASDVYVPAEHADWYKNLAEGQTAPVGFQVAKVHYKDESGAQVTSVMVMTKMAAGYDAENNDWFYGIYDESGTKAMKAGKVEACIDCHGSSDDTDYLGGLP